MREALEAAGVQFTPGGASLLHQLSLFLMSESNGAELQLHYTVEAADAVSEVLSVFGKVEGGQASIDAVQPATVALKQDLGESYRQKRRLPVAPQLHKLKKFVHALRDDRISFCFPKRLRQQLNSLSASAWYIV